MPLIFPGAVAPRSDLSRTPTPPLSWTVVGSRAPTVTRHTGPQLRQLRGALSPPPALSPTLLPSGRHSRGLGHTHPRCPRAGTRPRRHADRWPSAPSGPHPGLGELLLSLGRAPNSGVQEPEPELREEPHSASSATSSLPSYFSICLSDPGVREPTARSRDSEFYVQATAATDVPLWLHSS